MRKILAVLAAILAVCSACKVIVESRTSVKGVTWYEILPYGTQNIAFISGKYMTPCYDGGCAEVSGGKAYT